DRSRPSRFHSACLSDFTASGSQPRNERVRVAMVTIERVRDVAVSLPRTEEALVRERVRFRVGRIVYLAFSRDETLMGFAFPKDERQALIASEPEKFMMP